MLIKILGLLDILAGILFWAFVIFNFSGNSFFKIIITIFAIYLLIKGLFFIMSKDIVSIIDVLCAGIIFLSLNFNMPKFVVILVALFLLQKGILSLVA